MHTLVKLQMVCGERQMCRIDSPVREVLAHRLVDHRVVHTPRTLDALEILSVSFHFISIVYVYAHPPQMHIVYLLRMCKFEDCQRHVCL